jgi:hypothetical protein
MKTEEYWSASSNTNLRLATQTTFSVPRIVVIRCPTVLAQRYSVRNLRTSHRSTSTAIHDSRLQTLRCRSSQSAWSMCRSTTRSKIGHRDLWQHLRGQLQLFHARDTQIRGRADDPIGRVGQVHCRRRGSQNPIEVSVWASSIPTRSQSFHKVLEIMFSGLTRLRDAGYIITFVYKLLNYRSSLEQSSPKDNFSVVCTPKKTEFSIAGYMKIFHEVRSRSSVFLAVRLR